MGEPDPKHRAHLAEIFLPAYNHLHGTCYSNPTEPDVPGSSYDFRWKAPARAVAPLEVQHTRGALDPIGDRVHPKAVGRLHAAVEAWAKREAPRGYCISVGVPRPTEKAVGPDALFSFVLARLEEGVAQTVPPGRRLVLHAPRPYSGDPYPEIELHRLPADGRTFVLSTPAPNGYMPVAVPRLREAIDRKQVDLHGRRSTLVLLVDFDVDGYDADDLDALRREAAAGPVLFPEVWGISLWTPGERADRLWP